MLIVINSIPKATLKSSCRLLSSGLVSHSRSITNLSPQIDI